MKIVSWNVNSLKARLEHVKKFLTTTAPDVLMLQELKGLDVPEADFNTLGYETLAVPQKAYNGVAILSRHPMRLLLDKLPGDDTDEQARYLEVEINNLRLIDIYAPNGNPIDTEKYPYKLKWLDRLKTRLETLTNENIPFAIGGDFNIIPEDIDCFDPKIWKDDALFRIESRRKFRALLNLGLTDAFRARNPNTREYTFWDYQAGCWPQNKGIRIDHFLLSPSASDRLVSCIVDKTPRGWDKPSDHTPIIVELSE
ncbi:MAG: exodeoxyribonuclease III [Alphaproteobacteria bacterium]